MLSFEFREAAVWKRQYSDFWVMAELIFMINASILVSVLITLIYND